MLSLIFTIDEKAILYKPPAEAGPTKSAWGARRKFTSKICKIRSGTPKNLNLHVL